MPTPMQSAVAADFDVQCIASDLDRALFVAFRRGGRRPRCPGGLRVLGAWHIVEHVREPADVAAQIFSLRQWHIPRFAMAEAAESLLGSAGPGVARELAPGLCLRPGMGRGPMHLMAGGVSVALPTELSRKLKADVRLLAEARAAVSNEGDGFVVPTLTTPASHEVRVCSPRLAQAIAFERCLVRALDAGTFGVFSAYCTQRDFPCHRPEGIEGMSQDACWRDPESAAPHVLHAMAEAQRRVLGTVVWGPGIDRPAAEVAPIVEEGLRRLSPEQHAQMTLMGGMHDSCHVLRLAVVAGTLDAEEYIQQASRHQAPDSPDEQDLRTSMAYISLYGNLAADVARPPGDGDEA